MLMVNNRQLILVANNWTNTVIDFKVNKFHHPVNLLTGNKEKSVQVLACRNGNKHIINIFKSSAWILPYTTDIMAIERQVYLGYCCIAS